MLRLHVLVLLALLGGSDAPPAATCPADEAVLIDGGACDVEPALFSVRI